MLKHLIIIGALLCVPNFSFAADESQAKQEAMAKAEEKKKRAEERKQRKLEAEKKKKERIAAAKKLKTIKSQLQQINYNNDLLQRTSLVINDYRKNAGNVQELKAMQATVDRTWQDFNAHIGNNSALRDDLALVRARTYTANRMGQEVVPAWKEAIKSLPRNTATARRVSLYLEAAGAAAHVKDYKSSEQFFAVARTLAVSGNKNTDKVQLYMRMNELKTTAPGMKWRPLRDSLSDLRKYAELFSLWSIPRLDALLGEAELRVYYQPQTPEKREDLSELKAKIVLAEKGMGTNIPPHQLSRVRSLYYTLEDHWKL